MVIRPLRAGLEGFFEKNGKKLPVAGQCLRMMMGKVAFSEGLLASPKDLEAFIGPSGRVSEVLNRKRRLSLPMIKRLHHGLHIPYESLLGAV
jgi:antitoxin component HigA of HigAB toxin-antitoxin module